MKTLVPVTALTLFAVALSGCLGGDDEDPFDYVPGADWKPTGKKVAIRMWVVDIQQKEVYPGLEANFWAFCAAPVNPDDAYSLAAIEYREAESQCSTPGPTLRIRQGDEVEIRFENNHFHPHTIHWHGQHVPMEADGVPGVTQDSVKGGGTYTYSFVAKRAGTLWYHCHVDGQFHVMMGLYGAMIVEPQEKRYEPKGIDREYTLIFSTARREHIQYVPGADPHANHRGGGGCGVTGEQGCQNPAVDVTPDVFMLNGVSYPNTMDRNDTLLRIAADERIRVRLVNTGETFETFHLHGHDMLVTHKDGNPLPPAMRYYTETLPIGPAERYDVVIEGDKDAIGAWAAHTHVERHIANDGQHPGGMHTMLVYDEFEGDLHAYAAELPGGQPYEAPRVVPDDHLHEETAVFAPSRAALDVSHRFADVPVPEDLCLVEKVQVSVHVASGTLGWPTTALTLTIDHDRFKEPLVYTLDQEQPSATWTPTFADLKPGNHTVTLTGETLEASVTLRTVVDHFPSEASALAAGRPCGHGAAGHADGDHH